MSKTVIEYIRSCSEEDLFELYMLTQSGGDLSFNWCDGNGGCPPDDCACDKEVACFKRFLHSEYNPVGR
jgi:hypothetical protein